MKNSWVRRAAAARELVERVLGLKGKVPGIAIAGGPAEGMVVIAHRARRVGIAARSDGSIVVGQLVGGGRLVESTVEEVPLAFDPANGTLVGQGIDDSRAPIPGMRLPRRNALTVVVQFAVNVLRD